jgi:hypothetical protein
MNFMRKLLEFFIVVLLISGCEQQIISPPNTFQVTGTLAVQTVDYSGLPLSVPVTFKTFQNNRNEESSVVIPDSVTLLSDLEGWVEFSQTFELKDQEYFSILTDVSSPQYESLNYWTAYFQIPDAPAKRMEVQMVVVIKP